MKEFVPKTLKAALDLRVIVGICGILIGIAAHELFHIVIHWGEINSIHLFPDTEAIVEVIFTPGKSYNLAVEEAFAYSITMIAYILTAMLVNDIHDERSEKDYGKMKILKDFKGIYLESDHQMAMEHLGMILK